MRDKAANSVGSGKLVNGPLCLLEEFGFRSAGSTFLYQSHRNDAAV